MWGMIHPIRGLMAWTTAHFATGMICGGAISGLWFYYRNRRLGGLGLGATLGGIWAILPDLPRVFREDFPQLGLADSIGAKSFERGLHEIGDVFFMHASLDHQPKEYALHGLIVILFMYNLILFLNWRERRRLAKRLLSLGGDAVTAVGGCAGVIDESAEDVDGEHREKPPRAA